MLHVPDAVVHACARAAARCPQLLAREGELREEAEEEVVVEEEEEQEVQVQDDILDL